MWLFIRLNNAGKSACDRVTEHADFGKKKSFFSDEAQFDLGGNANKQNCRIWGTENPHAPKTSHYLVRILVLIFASKMTKERPLESMAIVIGPC